MNTLVQKHFAPTKELQFNYHSKSIFPEENHVGEYGLNHGFDEFSVLTNGSSSPVDESSSEGESFKEKDNSDAMLKFISQMLMEEEDLEKKPCMLHDCLALQATEKSLYDVLNSNLCENADSPSDSFTKASSTCSSESSSNVSSFVESNWNHHNQGDFEHFINPSSDVQYSSLSTVKSDLQSFGSSEGITHSVYRQDGSSMSKIWASNSLTESQELKSGGSKEEIKQFLFNDEFLSHSSEPKRKTADFRLTLERNERDHSLNNSKEKKNRGRGDSDLVEEHRSNKQLANNVGELETLEMFDKVLLCSNSDHPLMPACGEADLSEEKKKLRQKEESKGSNKGRAKGGKKRGMTKEVVDLRSLLMQCAQAVASYDSRTVNDLLMRIRQHSSPQGDGTERLAHYFANALEARLAGTGTELYAAFSSRRISAAEILKAYKTFITACPFRKMSNMFANKTINKLATGVTKIHIIDFGILYGFQWPCLIQALSHRPEGPPKLHITGIDFPQPGFRPAERVKETGCRIAKYCDRFNVPFEYTAIAQRWETIRVEDLKIDRNELLVVNSIYRLQNVPDETVMVNSPRDIVLNLIKKINPDLFIHGAVNGTYNTPFFITRFREALFHFSSMFDMFETSTPREDPQRLLFEEEVFGKEVMNIIACEGTERVERPETYKQWQGRNLRAGFRQLPLDQEIVKYVRNKVKREYHKDFSVDEDGMWMLQGWKGRVIHGLSYWKPANK